KASIPGSLSFDTEFPSFTFDMATGSGKTKLMGSCIYYLYKKGISRNFFILVPGDTIYKKTITDFTKGHERYVLLGASDLPEPIIITGENYEHYDSDKLRLSLETVHVFIFNIQKIWKPDFKFHSFKETLGASFSDLIKGLNDLVLLMDESHHYCGDASFKSVNELKPILGLEFTATPLYTKNIIYPYSLGQAMADGLVKRVMAVIRKNDRCYEEELEDLKIVDGLKIHKQKKVLLETYCKNHSRPVIKPLTFISTKDIAHGKVIQEKIESGKFMGGEFKGKTLYIHSGSEDAQIKELLDLEKEGKYEIVIHVNKLKEGWDVKNIYTIIPLRASISEILAEQTLGRGVRLPFYDVSKDEIEQNPDAFTLDVICYKLKGDNYKDIIDAAKQNNIITKDYDEDKGKGNNLIPRQVKPENQKYNIKIPSVESKIVPELNLKSFNIKVSVEYQKIQSAMEGVDVATGETKNLGKATDSLIENQFHSLIKRLIDETDELDYTNKWFVVKVGRDYLNKATKSNEAEKWERFLKMHRSVVFEDIQKQIQEHITTNFRVSHKFIASDSFVFKPYWIGVDKDSGVHDKKSSDEITHRIIAGYKKTVYPENHFDSIPEKVFADILDKDDNVKKWLRNPDNGLRIKYKYGNYYPDFIVETTKENYVIEIKMKKEIDEEAETVFEKANEGLHWCEKLSNATSKKWSYKLIPHDKVSRDDTFQAIIGSAIKI
ncbi:MAG: DEAD/DEAH box helicase family protein, partial [Elusimicrobia bacterium]|nr:DEAD/DEAH box helicase family protein [Elusimicrobiota bacterium]